MIPAATRIATVADLVTAAEDLETAVVEVMVAAVAVEIDFPVGMAVLEMPSMDFVGTGMSPLQWRFSKWKAVD